MSTYGTITVVHINKHHGACIYIGRAGFNRPASPLANPYKLRAGYSRDECIADYKRWLWEQIRTWGPAKDELERIADTVRGGQDVALACWCAPQACHGDVVKAALHWMLGVDPRKISEPAKVEQAALFE